MRLPFFPEKARDFTIATMTEEHAPVLATLHREDFVRPWTDGEFSSLIAQDAVFGFVALETGNARAGPVGFVLARSAADEGEILTIAVARSHRRHGLGWQLMDAALRELYGQRAEALFLEVDETNRPALGLYRRLGFREVGRRPAYYDRPDAAAGEGKSAALVMRRDLR